VRAHVARRSEARAEIRLQVVDGDERRGLARHAGFRVVEHMCVRIDQTGQHRCPTEINDLSSSWNFDLRFGPDFRDPLALQKDDLFRQHLAALAVEQSACPNGDHLSRRSAFDHTTVGSHAGRWSGSPPWSRGRLNRLRR